MRYTSLCEERFAISAGTWSGPGDRQGIVCWLCVHREPTAPDSRYGSAPPLAQLEVFCHMGDVLALTRTNRVNERQVKEVALKATLRYLMRELEKPEGQRCVAPKKDLRKLLSKGEFDDFLQGNVPAVHDDTEVLRKRRDFLRFRILGEIETKDLNKEAPPGFEELRDSDDIWAEADDVEAQVKAVEELELVRSESGGFQLTPDGEAQLKEWRKYRPWQPKSQKGPVGF